MTRTEAHTDSIVSEYDSTNLTDDVVVFDILGEHYVHHMTGVWTAGWPTVASLNRRHPGCPNLQSTTLSSGNFWSAAQHCVGIAVVGQASGVQPQIDILHMRIDVMRSS